MSVWLNELKSTLDAAPSPVSFFFRDDDAGWDDGRLFELLDLFERHSLPIDVAAIPSATTCDTAAELRARLAARPDQLAVHQHGFAHSNHEPVGRKCEFGASREPLQQQRDIESGRGKLLDLFGQRLSPLFTPPWNRCTEATGQCLLRAGFHVLSRDSTARPLDLAGLFELPVTVDWFARAKGVRLSPDSLGARLAAAAQTSVPVGVMFHHAPMDECERRRASELLSLLARHEKAQCSLMEQLVPQLSEEESALVAEISADRRSCPTPRPMSAERK